jgi:hypothetical protein
LKLAFNGVSDALSAGLSGDTEAFEKALKKLAPQDAETVKALVKLRDTWKPLAKDFQGRVFQGAAAEINSLSKFIKPVADIWLPRLAQRFAETRSELADGLARFAADGRLEAVWRNIHVAVSGLLSAVKPLAQAFADILEVAAPRFAGLAENIGIAAGKFADWIRSAKESGQLQKWLDKALEVGGKLKTVFANLGSAIAGISRASGAGGDSFLDNLVTWTAAISKWVNGGDGQKIIGMMASLISTLANSGPIFSAIVGYLGAMIDLWKGIGIAGSAIWEGIKIAARTAILLILDQFGMLINGAAKAFGWIPGIGPKLKGAAADFNAFRDSVNQSLNVIKKTIDIQVNYRAVRIGPHMVSGSQQSGTYSSGIGGRAQGGPMRAGVQYRINENGQEFIQLGQSGRACNARESADMASPGGGTPAWSGSMNGLDAMFFRWFQHAVRTGKLKLT